MKIILIMPRNFGEDKVIVDPSVVPTLDARMGTGGNNVPLVLRTENEEDDE